MKSLFFFTVLLVSFATFAQPTFRKSFGTPAYGENYDDMAKLKDGSFIVTGSTSNFGAGGFDAWCIKLDNNGNTVWSKTYGDSSSNTFTKVTATADGGFVICFTSYKDKYLYGDTLNGVFVVKCNKNGQVQWCRSIKSSQPLTGSLSVTPYQVYESKAGDIYVLSDWFSFDYNGNISLTKLDADGNFKWNTSVLLDIDYYSQFESVQVTEADNGNIIVGENAIGDDFYAFGDLVQISLFSQKTGANIINKIITQNYNNGFSYLRANSFTVKGNKLIVSGSYSHDNGGFSGGFSPCQFTLKPNDKQVTVYYDSSSGSFSKPQASALQHKQKQEFAPGSNSTKDGGYLYAYSSTYPDYNIIVEKRDSLGRVCSDSIPPPPSDTLSQQTIFDVYDNTNYILPYTIVAVDTTITVINVTAEKLLCKSAAPTMLATSEISKSAVANSLNKTGLQVYPNPSSNFITVTFIANQPATIQADIITMEGRKVVTESLFAGKGKQQVTLPVRNLAEGMYYIKLSGLAKTEILKFIKE